MNFWEKLRKWLGWAPQKEAEHAAPVDSGEPTKRPPVTEEPLAERKVTTTMLNSITLSSDMETLYLIDNGRAIPFKLSSPKGILIGTLGNQLVVATAVDKPDAPAPPDGGGGSGDDGSDTVGGAGETVTRAAGRPKAGTEIKFPILASSQWTLVYNNDHGVLGIIGVTDITGSITAPEDGNTKGTMVRIRERKAINLRREDNVLILSTVSDDE